ncbi:MAG: hypothetical protein GYA66_01670 [Phyllobacteriaceae bacterium]|nr:hypothetical protein [Phyllobacteriaceae bacterium]
MFANSVADDFVDFTISNGGTSTVTTTFGSQSIVLAGPSAITLTVDDFVFV